MPPPTVPSEHGDPSAATPYPPIEDYALISDCESVALVSRQGSIDWCCMPRMDADSSFGRLLDWRNGGHCSLAPSEPGAHVQRRYIDGTVVLQTVFETNGGTLELHDFFAMRGVPPQPDAAEQLVRLARCTRGRVPLRLELKPRFDFGAIVPDLRATQHAGLYTACGSDKGMLIHCNRPLALDDSQQILGAELSLAAGEALELSIRFLPPEDLAAAVKRWQVMPASMQSARLQSALETTLGWWADWEQGAGQPPHPDPFTRRSTVTLKALTFERTGAVVAAATTSLPESPGGQRNWDYRYSWLRDSVLAVRALHALGFEHEAQRFAQFIERSAAGNAEQLQPMFAIDGRRRLTEISLDHLEGWRGSRPVRVGNAAARQTQLDSYGHLLCVARLAHDVRPPDPDYWRFLVHAVDTTCARWREPDHGVWETRDAPRLFVHSKAMCWVTVDHGLHLASQHGLPAPTARWKAERDAMRRAIDTDGFDARRGVWIHAFGDPQPDSALLLLPQMGYVDAGDARMRRTTDWIAETLERDGLLLRYDHPDGLDGPEGAFVPCTFWLAECLAMQGRRDEAIRRYERGCRCANELGLFSEECDLQPPHGMLGNFPQLLTHLSQVTARLAIDAAASAGEAPPGGAAAPEPALSPASAGSRP